MGIGNNDKKGMNDNASKESNNKSTEGSGYYVNIDGEEEEVNVNSKEEYSCLMNCLEGYYVYGIGRDDDEDDND